MPPLAPRNPLSLPVAVDGQRDRYGLLSSVDRDDPDVVVAVRVAGERATIYLDAGRS
ncbi:MAG: THUMP domain-containing protein [Myxococcota bacterium]|nr:THUMP domain-containing protein [Myxococcota bacterium]